MRNKRRLKRHLNQRNYKSQYRKLIYPKGCYFASFRYILSLDFISVNWNEVSGKRNFRDMQLMSCAKHNIIGNSTYSWWGAWLNPNPDKIVIGPKKFFNPINEFFSKSDIMCDSWIKI